LSRHPSKEIIGKKGEELKGKTIALCITGSVAAVRCVEIARELMRHGAEVYAVMSQMAQKIIHPYLMEWATGNPVITELTGKIEHVALAGKHSWKVDLVLVAPATANTIGKIAHGIDDTPPTSVVSTALGSNTPIIVVPAMHESMYQHQIIKENIEKLKKIGIEFIGPRIEEQTAKIADTSEIIDAVISKLMIQDFSGLRVLVTAGPTVEYLDPIRIISNRSSGKMGVAVAREAMWRGADVTLIYGLGTASPPRGVRLLNVETTEEMYKAVVSELKAKKYDVVVSAAAAADFSPSKPYKKKVSTRKVSKLVLELEATKKIVDEVKVVSPKSFLVAFKAEYKLKNEELIKRAYQRLLECNADLIVANDVGRKGTMFGADTNEVFIIDRKKNIIHVPLMSKQMVARKILDVVSEKLKLGRKRD